LRANRSATAIEEAAKANTALGKVFPAMIAAMLIVIIIIGFHDEAVDRGVEIDDGTEDAPLKPPARQLGEEALDRVEPGGRGRREVEGPVRMSEQSFAHLRMLVGRVVVDDGVDRRSFWHLRLPEHTKGEPHELTADL
jgi:hypothetical protein